jgi:hypothetical protein
MGGWGCPHELDGKCQKINNLPCDIGMKGCVLAGRFRFADPSKNRPKKTQTDQVTTTPAQGDDKQ